MTKKRRDLIIAPLGEGGLIFAAAVVGWLVHAPLVFTSLGPTAYEILERPNSKVATTYNIVAGHCLGLGAGFLGLWLVHGFGSAKVVSAEFVASPRIWAAAISVVLTTLAMLLFDAGQPAALSTTLLVSLGSLQTMKGAVAILGGVLLIATLGEPIRRQRASASPPTQRPG